MINGRKVLGLVTARGGSKGVPGKNLRMVAGKPLLAWTFDAANASEHLDRLIISTDDEAIIATSRSLGCEVPFRREPHLATDQASSMDVVLDVLSRCPGYDYVVLLQPTSPLRRGEDIDGALRRCEDAGAPACVSVCEVTESPYWMFTLDRDHSMRPLLGSGVPARRQDLPPVFMLNGAVYVGSVADLGIARSFLTPRTVAYEMPADRSVDIDSEEDLRLAERALAMRSQVRPA